VNEPEQAGSTPIFGRLAEIISPAIKSWGMSRRSQVALLYFERLAEVLSRAIKAWGMSRGSQVALLYFLACSYDALLISGFLSFKRGRPLVFDILTPCLLLLFLYLVLRFAAAEDEYIRKHPFRFYGSVRNRIFPVDCVRSACWCQPFTETMKTAMARRRGGSPKSIVPLFPTWIIIVQLDCRPLCQRSFQTEAMAYVRVSF
jgi:hypothetical protein